MRSAFNTGMYQTSIGAHHHRSHRNGGCRLPEGMKLISERFREAGYFTANLDAKSGLQGTGKADFNFNAGRPSDGTDWTARRPGQPFYADLNFRETHRIFRRFAAAPVDPARVKLPPFYPGHPALREDWTLDLDAAQHLDVKVGRVLYWLEEQGLRDSTILFLFGDHSEPMPRGKQFLSESGIRVPLIVWFPERFRPAGVQEQDRYRIEIDGWRLLQSQSPISRSAGGLKVGCAPKDDQLVRSWVAPAVRFRARSKDVQVTAFRWMTIEEIFPSPAQRKPVELRAAGEWGEYQVAFDVPSGQLKRQEELIRRIRQRLAQAKPQAEQVIPAPPAPEPPETPPNLAGVDPATPMVQ